MDCTAHTDDNSLSSSSSTNDIENAAEDQLSETKNNILQTSNKDSFGDERYLQTCAICLEPYVTGKDSVSWSKFQTCIHAFHQKCIESWLIEIDRDGSCPCCRSPYLKLDLGENNIQNPDLESHTNGAEGSPTINGESEEFISAAEESTMQIKSQSPGTSKSTDAVVSEITSFCTVHGLIIDRQHTTMEKQDTLVQKNAS